MGPHLSWAARYDYEKIGQGRRANDALMAMSAARLGITVITANARERELFAAALKHTGTCDLTNTVVEVRFVKDEIQRLEYELPQSE